jgi:hypothetical protein
MNDTINLVYDDWPLDQDHPNPNGDKYFPEPNAWMTGDGPMETLRYNNYVHRRMEDVDKFQEENFFYVVWHRHSLYNRFLHFDRLPIGDDMIGHFQRKPNLFLLLINDQEIEPMETISKLDLALERNKIDPKKVFLVNNNSRNWEYKRELGSNINVHSCRAMPLALAKIPRSNFVENKEGCFFMSHNHSLRESRSAFVCLLKKYNLIDDFDWSYLKLWRMPTQDWDGIYRKIFNDADMKFMMPEIEYFNAYGVKKSNYESHFSWLDEMTIDSPSWWETFNSQQYENTYFNVTVETQYFGRDLHITEKSFKPFIHLQFPMILASRHHIKHMREYYGYDFFDDVINHDYDNVKSDRDRIFRFIEELKRIQENKEFFIEFYKNNKERFLKNQEMVYSFTNEYDATYFKALTRFDHPKQTLNLVYDNWDMQTNRPIRGNSEELYPNTFHMNMDSVVGSLQFDKRLIRRYRLEDVPKMKNQTFFYFVTLIPGILSENIKAGKPPINRNAVNTLKECSNFNIIIMNEQEAERKETLVLLDKWSKELELNQGQIWFSNNNPRLQEFKDEIGTEINVHSTVRLANFTANSVIHSVGRVEFKPDKEGEFFMCHNRRPRPHRYGLLCLLKKTGVLEDVDWSLVQGFQFKDNKHPESFFGEIFNEEDIENMREEISYFSSIEQKKSKYEEERTWFDDRDNENNVPWNETYDKNQLENSYFNITTETEFSSDLTHISEKSFKSFCAMQFPMILASAHHIREIKKKYDFDFFDDVINHDYDDEENHRDRLFKFVKEIKRINENKEFFIEFYKNNKFRFEENLRKIEEKVKDQSDSDFLKRISGII